MWRVIDKKIRNVSKILDNDFVSKGMKINKHQNNNREKEKQRDTKIINFSTIESKKQKVFETHDDDEDGDATTTTTTTTAATINTSGVADDVAKSADKKMAVNSSSVTNADEVVSTGTTTSTTASSGKNVDIHRWKSKTDITSKIKSKTKTKEKRQKKIDFSLSSSATKSVKNSNDKRPLGFLDDNDDDEKVAFAKDGSKKGKLFTTTYRPYIFDVVG